MKKYVKKLQSEEGFTVIELIASMALVAIFGSVIYGVISFGLNTYNKIEVENSLRDEADLLMSSIINELYMVAPDKIIKHVNGIQLIKNESAATDEIYFTQGRLMIGGKELADLKSEIGSESTITLVCEEGLGECASGLIEISLILIQSYSGKSHQLTLESKFGF
ncbi:PulJ/GspJ family protein [Paenibacillus sp. sgz302251]|uniref:PulJ/GspJ family protein n=1 Tax=Paenibacillus sp. sgz302251 TaxID=3414493 RepID=UPI003C7B2B34